MVGGMCYEVNANRVFTSRASNHGLEEGGSNPQHDSTRKTSSENRIIHPLVAEFGDGLDECYNERVRIILAR